MSLQIKPITFREASAYINANHRHNKATVGCKFCIAVYDENRLCGVAVCGRPIGRKFDNGEIAEINRVCTDGTYNACSKLYGACCRIAKEMGYKQIITYTLESENGASLRASNFVNEGRAGKDHWTGERNKNQDYLPACLNRDGGRCYEPASILLVRNSEKTNHGRWLEKSSKLSGIPNEQGYIRSSERNRAPSKRIRAN